MVRQKTSEPCSQPRTIKLTTTCPSRIHDVRRNKILFWAIIFGFVTIFPTLYIPVINHVVFKHAAITWEWAAVVVATLLFFLGVEAWKFGKRIYFRRNPTKRAAGLNFEASSESEAEKGENEDRGCQ
jgi:Na+-exporting ATPase